MSGNDPNTTRYLYKHFWQIKSISYNPLPFFLKLLEKYGSYVNISFLNSFALTNDPRIIRYILQKNNKNFKKAPFINEAIKAQVGNGILTTEGPRWLKQRRAVQPGFHRKRLESISKTMTEVIDEYLTTEMLAYAEKKRDFMVDKEMMHLAYKIVSKSLFGDQVDEALLGQIDEIISKGQEYTIFKIRRPFSGFRQWASGEQKRNRKRKEFSDQLVLDIIRNRMKSQHQGKDDLLQMLLDTEYEDGTKMNEQELLDESMILYVAGHETTALALSWAFYLVAKHPDIEEKILKEADTVLGNRNPQFNDLMALPYSLQVLNESMRLYPPVWIIDRQAKENDEFEGVRFKKDKAIMCLIYAMHRHPDYWPNPEKFDPERFALNHKNEKWQEAFMPFGVGPRLCIGNSFALMEMQLVLIMTLRRFRFILNEKHPIELNPLITLRPRHGIKMRVVKRFP